MSNAFSFVRTKSVNRGRIKRGYLYRSIIRAEGHNRRWRRVGVAMVGERVSDYYYGYEFRKPV